MPDKPKRVAFRVEFDMPPFATLQDARAYLDDAVGSMKGCYKPPQEDPEESWDAFSQLDNSTIKITFMRKGKTNARS